jgi:hypothetical protein
VGGGIVAVLLAFLVASEFSAQRAGRAGGDAGAEAEDAAEPADGGAGAFPLPPMDLPHYHGVGVTSGAPQASVAPGSAGPATVADTAREVTGA